MMADNGRQTTNETKQTKPNQTKANYQPMTYVVSNDIVLKTWRLINALTELNVINISLVEIKMV